MASEKWLPIWESRPYPPLLMSLVIDSTIFGFKKVYPPSKISKGAYFWHKGSSNYLYLESDIRKTANLMASLALKKPQRFFHFFETAYLKSLQFNKQSKYYSASKVQQLSDQDLLRHLDRFSQSFFNFFQHATIASWFGYNQANPLYVKMNKILEAKLKGKEEKFADFLVVLTNPPKLLKTNHLDLALLKLAALAKKQKRNTVKEIKKYFSEELISIYEKYKFLSFDFTIQLGWSLDDFAKRVAEKTKLNIPFEIKKIKTYEKENDKSYRSLCQMLGLKESEIRIFDLVRNLGYYKWLREYEFQEGFFRHLVIIDELGRRCGLKKLPARYILPREWLYFLKNQKAARLETRLRMQGCLYLSQWGKNSKIYSGLKATKEYRKISLVRPEIDLAKNVIKGTPAFSGLVQGRVKIVNEIKDIKKMEPGNILVSSATSPSLLVAMKKASAIVTDEGGITCHAAIVSRELGIPCVVGTKTATRVLKDNDWVEIDANRGIIKKIKKP